MEEYVWEWKIILRLSMWKKHVVITFPRLRKFRESLIN